MITRLCHLSRIALMCEIGLRRLSEIQLSSFCPMFEGFDFVGKDSCKISDGFASLRLPDASVCNRSVFLPL